MSERNKAAKTGSKQGVASGNPLGLRHPALTPMPEALRPRPIAHVDAGAVARAPKSRGGAMAGRRTTGRQSGYVINLEALQRVVSPLEDRARRTGRHGAMVARLERVRVAVDGGATIRAAVTDGQVDSWHARQALTHALGVGQNVTDWDQERFRTQGERLALVERVLAELGVGKRRGGWSVSGR